MRVASVVARYLLGLMFTVFGLNGFFNFLHQPPPTSPLVIQFMTVMAASHYFAAVFLVQLVAGILLLVNRYVPLALTMLAAVIFNILVYHGMLNPSGIGPGVLAAVLWILVFVEVRPAFRGIFQATTPRQPVWPGGVDCSGGRACSKCT